MLFYKSAEEIEYEETVYKRHEAMLALNKAREAMLQATRQYDAACLITKNAFETYQRSKNDG